MDPDRARELLAEERKRIEHALAGFRREDVGELADRDEPADQASDLYENELDEGLAEGLRATLAAVERAEARLAAGTYGLSVERPADSRRAARGRSHGRADGGRAGTVRPPAGLS